MVADLYLRASGQSLLRLLPPTVRESVKKIELAVIRKKYKPLRPAIVYGNPIKKLRGFTLAPNSTVYVIVTDRELYIVPKGNQQVLVSVDYKHITDIVITGKDEDIAENGSSFDNSDVNLHSRSISFLERFSFDCTNARKRFKPEIDARTTYDNLLLKQIERIEALSARTRHSISKVHDMRASTTEVDEATGEASKRKLWRGFLRKKNVGNPTVREVEPARIDETTSKGLDDSRLHYPLTHQTQNASEQMGFQFQSENGRYSQVLTILTIEPETSLPFQVTWAVLGNSLRKKREADTKEEIFAERRKSASLGTSYKTLFPSEFIQHINLRLRDEVAPKDRLTTSLANDSDSGPDKLIVEAEIQKFCRNLLLEYNDKLQKGNFSLYARDEDLIFLTDLRRVASLFPFFRRIIIQSQRVVPNLIYRLIACIDTINESSPRAIKRYEQVMRNVFNSSPTVSMWCKLILRLEKVHIRKQMMHLFDALIAILQDSERYIDRLAIIRQDGEYGLLHLIDVCFEYRSSKSTSKDMSQLRKTEQREGSLFVPIATFDQALNVVDESFTFKFVGLLFQSFSIYHHAYSAGLVNDPNFLNSLMQKIDSSDVDIHGGYIFVLLTKLIFNMKDESDASIALQFSYVMKMLFMTDKGWQLRSYLKENYSEELKYILMTKAGKQILVDISQNCVTAGWSINTFWDVLRLSDVAPHDGRCYAGDSSNSSHGKQPSSGTNYQTFAHIKH